MYRVKNEKKGSGKILNIKFLLAQSFFGRKPGLRSVTGQRPPLCGDWPVSFLNTRHR